MATNKFFRSGTVDRKTYSDQLSKTFDVMWLRSKAEVTELQEFFETINMSEGDTFKIGSVGSSLTYPIRNEDTDTKPFAQVATGYNKTITVYPYRLFVRVTDNMRRMERYSKVEGMVSGLPMAAVAKKEAMRATIFNSQTFSGTAGADSLALCHNSHPHENTEYGTWDNLSTGVLNVDNLHTLRLLADKMTNEFGRPYPVELKKLLIPPDLRRKAAELMRADMDPESALNTPNVLINEMTYKVSHKLTDTDAYFGFGNLKGEERGILEVSLMAPEVKDDEPANVDILIQKRIKFICAFGYTRSKNIVASAGA